MVEVREKNDVMKYLSGMPLPVDRYGLIKYARYKGAPQDVINMLEKVPEQQFRKMDDVWKAVCCIA